MGKNESSQSSSQQVAPNHNFQKNNISSSVFVQLFIMFQFGVSMVNLHVSGNCFSFFFFSYHEINFMRDTQSILRILCVICVEHEKTTTFSVYSANLSLYQNYKFLCGHSEAVSTRTSMILIDFQSIILQLASCLLLMIQFFPGYSNVVIHICTFFLFRGLALNLGHSYFLGAYRFFLILQCNPRKLILKDHKRKYCIKL